MGCELALGLLAIGLGTFGAFVIGRFGGRLGLIDQPNIRSSHSRETPKGGGVGIASTFLLTAVVLDMPIALWLPLGAVAGLSLRGDQVEISPKLRLPVQFILMGILVIGLGAGIYQGIPRILMTVFWIVFIVGTANFFNFMDGINGIAAISGVVGFGLLTIETYKEQPEVGLLAVCMALACLGFLPFNLPRARVFMGDVGSILLGGVFAGLVFLASRTVTDFLCMISFLFPFYADELTTMIVRIRAGENLTQAHRRHIYQLLANERQIPHWKVSAGYGLFQLLVGISALISKKFGIIAVLTVLAIWSALFITGSYYVRREHY
ncbi:MAG: glycosyltransferase family 4 protein [Candidatus Aminicenantes bacterium]|nr:glycosyltransferase family 4 protein [Candidatus Aminicenantes bacterium]